jgi:hypothetical protein
MLGLLFAVDAAADACVKGGFFGLVPWYKYRETDPSTCEIKDFIVLPDPDHASSIPLVLLAIVDDLLRIAGLVAVAFVIYGAIKYTTSEGNPDQANSARHTVINALVGLVVAIMGVAFVSFVGNSLLK